MDKNVRRNGNDLVDETIKHIYDARDHYRKGKSKMVEELDSLLQACQDDESDSVASWEEPFNMN